VNNNSCPESRRSLVNRQLKEWEKTNGLPEYSPHKFRHGHVHYGNERARTYADFKAVSLNVMHSSTKITDQYYSVLTDKELRERIQNLGNQPEQEEKQEDLFREFQAFLEWKKEKN
jgi:integrase